ncbi:hypothetical protein ATCC90586_003063 [Pythium insidiosum]|nr:hypothetical protein ATCC90586_003063 [Pythium insidiosum]
MAPLFRGDLYHHPPAPAPGRQSPVDMVPPMRLRPYETADQWRARERQRHHEQQHVVIPESPDDGGGRQRWAARPPLDPRAYRPESEDDDEEDESGSYDGADLTRRAGPVRASSSKKRSRRMSNSERGKLYRSRRKEYVDSLEQTVAALKREIEQLRVSSTPQCPPAGPPRPALSSQVVVPRDRTPAALARVVCEYFTLFEFGVPVAVGDAPVSSDALARSTQQVEFLHSQVRPDMRFGDKYGIPMLLEQWERYSLYHAALQFTLASLAIDATPPRAKGAEGAGTRALVAAHATLRVRFTRRTIEQVFPHVLWNESLVQKLIGREIEYPVSNRFYFDDDGKITQYETEVDFVGAFIRALGSEHEASQLVGHALIKAQHMIGPIEDDDDAVHSGRIPVAHPGTGSEQVRVPVATDRLKPPMAVSSASFGSASPVEPAVERERFTYHEDAVPTHRASCGRYPRYDSMPQRGREYEARSSNSYIGCESFV